MNICVVGEGRWDVGGMCAGERYDGDVPLVVGRIAREKVGRGVRFGCCRWGVIERTEDWPDDWKDGWPAVHPAPAERWPRPPAEGTARQLWTALCLASQGTESGDFDALVFVRDSRWDGHDEREKACRQVLKDFATRGSALAVVVGFAIQEIEAWLLADPEARAAAFGESAKSRECGAPEEIENPKQCWQSLLGEAPGDATEVERRKCAIDAMRPKVVAERCPRGFGPFREEVKTRIVRLLDPEARRTRADMR